MKKRVILSVILVILMLLYGVLVSLLFFGIQGIKAPEIIIDIDPLELTSTYMEVQMRIQTINPNVFDLIIDDMNITLYSRYDTRIGYLHFGNNIIPSNGKKTLIETIRIQFNDDSIDSLKANVKGVISAEILGLIKKTLPFSLTIRTTIGEVLSDVILPEIRIDADISRVSQEGVTMGFVFMVKNMNNFELYMRNMTISLVDENSGEEISRIRLNDTTMKPMQLSIVNSTSLIPITVLNSRVIVINAEGVTGLKVAGLNKTMPFSILTRIRIPNIKDVFPSEKPTLAVIKTKTKPSFRGVIIDMTLQMQNPNPLALEARNITFTIYRVDSDEQSFIASCIVDKALINANSTVNISAQALLPYSKILAPMIGRRLMPSTIRIIVSANVTLAGLNQYLWVGVSGYQNLRLLR